MPVDHLKRALPFVLLTALVAIAYVPGPGVGFVSDDWAFIVDNEAHLSPSAVPGYFTSGVWANSNLSAPDTVLYRPVWLVWEFLVHAVAGENPLVWRFSNLALHALNALLVAALIGRLFPQATALHRAGGAAIFAVHPAAARSVVWISGSTDVLLATFFVSAVLLYGRWRETGRGAHFAGAVTFFALAALTKEPGIVLPLVIVAYDLCKGTPLRDLPASRYAVLFGIAAGYLAVRAGVLGGALEGGAGFQFTTAYVSRFVEYAVAYARFLVVPWPLPLYLEHPGSAVAAPWELALGLAVAGLMAWAAARDRPSAFALVWIALTLAPPLALALRAVGSFDPRFLHLPAIGLAIMATAALLALGRRWGRVAAALPAALAAGLAFGAHGQSLVWKDQLAFSRELLRQDPKSVLGVANLALYYLRSGDREAAIRAYEDALASAGGDYAKVQLTEMLMELYVEDGRYDDTLRIYQDVSRLRGYEALGYVGVGNSYWAMGKLEEALAAYRRALSFDPNNFDALYSYGRVSETLRLHDQATESYQRLLAVAGRVRLNPKQLTALEHARDFLRASRPPAQTPRRGGAAGQEGPQRP